MCVYKYACGQALKVKTQYCFIGVNEWSLHLRSLACADLKVKISMAHSLSIFAYIKVQILVDLGHCTEIQVPMIPFSYTVIILIYNNWFSN